MNRVIRWGVLTCGLLLGASLSPCIAHQIYVFVPTGSSEVRIAFGHGPVVEADASVERVKLVSLRAVLQDGRVEPIETQPGQGGGYVGRIDPQATVQILGHAAVGVTQRGEQPAQLTTYYPQTWLGHPFVARPEVASQNRPHADWLEIVPHSVDGQVQFQVLWQGRPLENVSVEVLEPDAKFGSLSMKSDANGFSSQFALSGRYAVAATYVIPESGQHEGRAYTQIRHIATLVVDIP